MTPLATLADRVEAAEGASRELDADIAVAIRWSPPGIDERLFFNEEIRPLYAHRVPAYTASLDAAMGLADDADRAQLLNDAMEMTSVCGWHRGDYLGQLTRNFVGQCLRARASIAP